MSYKIVIFETDGPTARSQMGLLGHHHQCVEVEGSETSLRDADLRADDIIVIDLDEKAPDCFRALDILLRTARLPKILITAFENDILESSDCFNDCVCQILFKPYLPRDFVAAVHELSLA